MVSPGSPPGALRVLGFGRTAPRDHLRWGVSSTSPLGSDCATGGMNEPGPKALESEGKGVVGRKGCFPAEQTCVGASSKAQTSPAVTGQLPQIRLAG